MPYQYVREPLTVDQADRCANAGETPTEQLVVWALLPGEDPTRTGLGRWGGRLGRRPAVRGACLYRERRA
jgi:hypothetical protein